MSTQVDMSLSLPFPQIFRKNEHDKQYQRFLDTLKQLQINIPLVDALVQILSYEKFMKNLLSKKKKPTDIETIALTEGCSVILTNKLPLKLKDPRSFTIPCSIGNYYLCKALCHLGGNINLMPLSTFRKLRIGHMKSTVVTLQLAGQSLAQPEGQIKDILVRVDKFIFLADFIILDCNADKEIPIILGRPFLATGRTLIDVYKGELTVRLNDKQVTFSFFESNQCKDKEECIIVDVLDDIIEEEFNDQTEANNLELKHGWQIESLDLANRTTPNFKPSIEEAPTLELKPLPHHLKYVFLGDHNTLPVIVSATLDVTQEEKLVHM
ncbi:uncharacterized protein LOC108468780 [Gossypium arboreum]|uniref:uncharacterized protein LOC108468780 n=1 Tax=Gossypium arboreum TaxID=29729 RepID=UPI0008190B19|nr:uncharacterized protein LOC108468780 [Gossypium arboreum]